MLSAKLVVVGGDAKRREVNLKLPTVIGRGREGVTLTLPHKLVSRKHTEIFEREGSLFVRDLGSLNGTFVNNQRIESDQLIKPNELLTLGNVTFRAVYDPVAAGSVTPNDSNPVTSAPISAGSSDVMDEDSTGESTSSSTDNSLLETTDEAAAAQQKPSVTDSSDIFGGAEIKGLAPEKSISMSSLGGLPTGNEASFVGGELNLGSEVRPEQVVDNVNIELEEVSKAPESDNSQLGSFLKKLPR